MKKNKKKFPTKEEIIKELYERAKPALKKPEKRRSYKERVDVWYYRKLIGEVKDEWDEGEEVEILEGAKLAKGDIKNYYDGEELPAWFKEWGNNFGKKVIIRGEKDEVYTLIGVSITFVDLYFILEDENKKRKKVSCVIPIDLLL